MAKNKTKLQILNMIRPIKRKTGWTITASGKMTLKSAKGVLVEYQNLGDFITDPGEQRITNEEVIGVYKMVAKLPELKSLYRYTIHLNGELGIRRLMSRKPVVIVYKNLGALEKLKKSLTETRYDKYSKK